MLDGRLDAPAAFPRRRNRRARGGAMSLAAGGAAAAAMAVAEAQGVQAKPVAVLHDLKGKGRALVSRGQDSAGRVRPPSGPGWLKGGQPAAGAAGLRRRTVQPAGLPAHYEYRDGEWVYSDDWSLNGRQGAPREASSVQEGSQEKVAADADSDYDVDSMEDNDTPPTSLGWARTSNNVLGVDIVTDLTDSSSSTTTTRAVLTSAPTSMASTSTSTGLAAQRTNMATLTSPSATAATATASASSGSTSGSGSGQTYDFRRDVPDGWLSDGRTAAYAVPVIVGLSIFLSCLIFSLLVIFVRATTSRRARRKQAVKLQEEGRMKKLQLPDEDGNFPSSSGGGSVEFDDKHGIATPKKKARIGRRWTPAPNGSLRRRRRDIAKLFNRKSGDDTAATIEVVDEHPLRLTRTLSSEADPTAISASNSSRQEGSRALENVSEGMRDIEESRPTTRDGLLSVPMGRVGSDISSEARMTQTGEDGDEDEADVANGENEARHASSSTSTSSGVATDPTGTAGVRDVRPPLSIRIDSPVLHLDASSTTGTSTVAPDDASLLPVIAARRSSSDSDTHAVPLPSVGPPAYIHPPSPAYSRGVALPGDSYLTHLSCTSASAPIASRYLSASAVSTPGLPSNIDEKRLLLAHQAQAEALPSNAASGTSAAAGMLSSDPYREQRRYEHLYASREGEAASAEQRSGAPSSSRIDNESDVPRERLAGHIAVDDKDVLERIRGARSAPDAPPSVGLSQGSSAMPNAPSFEQDDDIDHDDFQHAISASQRAGPSTARASALPLPPRALDFASAFTAFSPIDDKARLRMFEEQQAATFVDPAMQGSAPPLAMPSAPPSMPSASPALTMPSAPAFEDDHIAAQTEVLEPSAPAFIIEADDEEVETENGQVDQENRPFREGTI